MLNVAWNIANNNVIITVREEVKLLEIRMVFFMKVIFVLIVFNSSVTFAANLSALIQGSSSSISSNFSGIHFTQGGIGGTPPHGAFFCKKTGISAHGEMIEENINEGLICNYTTSKYCSSGTCTGNSGTNYLVLYRTSSTIAKSGLAPRATGDAKCVTYTPTGLTCTNKRAFLVYSTTDTIANIPTNYSISKDAPIFWFHESNQAITYRVGANFADILDGSIENNAYVGTGDNNSYFTGSDGSGAYKSACGIDWASTASNNYYNRGSADFSDDGWLNYFGNNSYNCTSVSARDMLCICEK